MPEEITLQELEAELNTSGISSPEYFETYTFYDSVTNKVENISYVCMKEGNPIAVFRARDAAEYYNDLEKFDEIIEVETKRNSLMRKCSCCGNLIHDQYAFGPDYPEKYILCCSCKDILENIHEETEYEHVKEKKIRLRELFEFTTS